MKRFFRIHLRCWSLEIQKNLVYQPVMSIFSYLAHAAWITLTFVFVTVVGTKLSARTQLELLLFLSYFHTVKALFWIPCSQPSGFLAGSAFREGKIDFWLTKPLPSQLFISTFRPNIFAFTDLFVGALSFFYFLNRLGILNLENASLYIFSAVSSTFLLYAVWFSYLTFFIPSGEASAAHGMMNLLWVFGGYPNRIYSGISKVISLVIFPTVIITTLPMAIIIGQKDPAWTLVLAGAAVFGLFISTKLWSRMLRFYTSAN